MTPTPDQTPRLVADTAALDRVYFDASHWNRLLVHPDRDAIVAGFDREHEAVLPSVINAAELLNDGDDERRSSLCRLMAALHRREHVLLDHPGPVLKAASDGYRRGERSFVLREGPAARVLRRQVEQPGGLTDEMRGAIRDWTDAMEADQKALRRELREGLAGPGFQAEAESLPEREDFANLVFEKISEVRAAARSAQDVSLLIRNTAVWAAYAYAIAYEFHLQRHALTPDERAKPPGGPDHRQLVYLGFVNRFVSRDRGLLRAAKWIADAMPASMPVSVMSSVEYFERIGYPFPEESSRRLASDSVAKADGPPGVAETPGGHPRRGAV